MRPLPRVLAYCDDRVAALEDFGVRAAAIAAGGSAVGVVARLPNGSAEQLTVLGARCAALVRPPAAALFVTGRVDIAMALGASGTILRARDLSVADARAAIANANHRPDAARHQLLRSVHSLREAHEAIDAGADGVIVGPVWETASHPGERAAGLELLREVAALGAPTWAIGGITAARAVEAAVAGAWGVAAVSSLWDATDPYQATRALLAAWQQT